jgi:uncharacterized protein
MFKHNRQLRRFPDTKRQAYKFAQRGIRPMENLRRSISMVLAIVACGSIAMPLLAQTPPEAQRISVQIATGPVSGSYLSVGETVARIISNPPGLARCDVDGVCGPKGLIATSRSSSGSIANVIAVNSGRVKSAIVQGDVARAAWEGAGPFKVVGAMKNLRVAAKLHDETLHLVVGTRSRIKRLSDLVGKRVAIDGAKTSTNFTARAVLAAAKISTKRLHISLRSPEQAAADIRDGKLDAFFVIGAAPVRPVDWIVRRGQARIVGIDARVIASLVKKSPVFHKVNLPGGTYLRSRDLNTLGVASIWLVHEEMPADLVYGMLRALWNPANRVELERLGKLAATMQPARATESLPLPLHEGAARFYAEAGR